MAATRRGTGTAATLGFAQLTSTYTAYPANSIFGTGMETATATEKFDA